MESSSSPLARALGFFVSTQLVALTGLWVNTPTTGQPTFLIVALGIVTSSIPEFLFAYWCTIPRKPSQGELVVRFGYPAKRGTMLGHCLYVTSAITSFIGILMLHYLPTRFEEESFAGAFRNLYSMVRYASLLTLGIYTVMAVWLAFSSRHEVSKCQARYASSIQYDTLAAAKRGCLVLGHKFEYSTEVQVSPAAEPVTAEPWPGEVTKRNIEKLVGEDGPFLLDLENERNANALVTGVSGSGKSETLRAIVLRYWIGKRIPTLWIDWLGEHSKFIQDIGGVVWRVPSQFGFNPAGLRGASPTKRAAQIAEALRFAGDPPLTAFQSGELKRVIMKSYEEAGILETAKSTWTREPPRWSDIIRTLEANLEAGLYQGTLKESALSTREKLYSILPITGREPSNFFDIVMRLPTCIDLSGLETENTSKAVATYFLYQRVYEQFFIAGFSRLKLLVLADEAHYILGQREAESAITRLEPLPLQIIRLTRKYGFGTILASQLMSDIPVQASANVAVLIAHLHEDAEQVSQVRKRLNLSKQQLEMYRNLPRGAALIKRIGQPYPDLLKVQITGEDEKEFARAISRSVGLPQTKPTPSPQIGGHPTAATTPTETRVSRTDVSEEQSLTSLERQLLRELSFGPVTFAAIKARLSSAKENELRKALNALEGTQIQSARVSTVEEGKSEVYYAALKSNWLQSESLEHRAIVLQLMAALRPLHVIVYSQKPGACAPDLALELTRTAIEVETGRKKLSPTALEEWASSVKQTHTRLGYKRSLVVVPNAVVHSRYVQTCMKQGIEIVTISKVMSRLFMNEKPVMDSPSTNANRVKDSSAETRLGEFLAGESTQWQSRDTEHVLPDEGNGGK